jgi:hypothetical protein
MEGFSPALRAAIIYLRAAPRSLSAILSVLRTFGMWRGSSATAAKDSISRSLSSWMFLGSSWKVGIFVDATMDHSATVDCRASGCSERLVRTFRPDTAVEAAPPTSDCTQLLQRTVTLENCKQTATHSSNESEEPLACRRTVRCHCSTLPDAAMNHR